MNINCINLKFFHYKYPFRKGEYCKIIKFLQALLAVIPPGLDNRQSLLIPAFTIQFHEI